MIKSRHKIKKVFDFTLSISFLINFYEQFENSKHRFIKWRGSRIDEGSLQIHDIHVNVSIPHFPGDKEIERRIEAHQNIFTDAEGRIRWNI